MLKVIAPVLSLIGVPMSIWCLGEYGDLWCLFFCWFCLTIFFWWYLANVVFTTSKRDRRNAAFRKVTEKARQQERTNSKITHLQDNTYYGGNQ